MRIAIFTEVFPPKIDGICNRLRNTLDCMLAAGHEVLVFAPDTAVASHGRARVVRLPSAPFPGYPDVRMAAADPRVAWELARFRPDVVHAVNPVTVGLQGLLAAAVLGMPRVASYHTDLPRYLAGYGLQALDRVVWPLLRRVHNLAHVNLCPSRFTQRELQEHDVENVGLWRGGVDTELYHPSRRDLEMRMRLTDGCPDGPVLLYVGRLAEEKNLSMLGPLLDALPEARLAFVGDGPARESLAREFQHRRAAFVGFLRGEELASAFASADVFVMPSRTETLGFVVLEAMASGLPVVAARAGGIPDLVRHGETGLLFDPDEPEQAIAMTRRLLERPGERRFLGNLARKAAEDGSWTSETKALVGNYRRAIYLSRRAGFLGRVRRALPI